LAPNSSLTHHKEKKKEERSISHYANRQKKKLPAGKWTDAERAQFIRERRKQVPEPKKTQDRIKGKSRMPSSATRGGKGRYGRKKNRGLK